MLVGLPASGKSTLSNHLLEHVDDIVRINQDDQGKQKCFETISKNDEDELKQLIKNHFKYTNSELAYKMLDNWEQHLKNFVKVMPTDYKKALIRLENEKLINQETTA